MSLQVAVQISNASEDGRQAKKILVNDVHAGAIGDVTFRPGRPPILDVVARARSLRERYKKA